MLKNAMKIKQRMNLPTLNATRKAYILRILDTFDQEHINNPGRNIPLDLYLRYFFLNEKKKVDGFDRESIVDYVYNLMMYKGYLNAICKKPMTWESRFKAFLSPDFEEQITNEGLPEHVRLSFPKDLFDEIVKAHGPQEAEEICRVQNERGLLTLMRAFKQNGWKVQPTQFAPHGIRFIQKPQGNFFAMQEFKEGNFEVQDEASQLLSMRVDAKPGDIVLDYCGGSGGKTLGFAPFMHNKGQIFMHDIRKSVLIQAKQRFRRAGIQNVQVHHDKEKLRSVLKEKCDWVMLDVPCTGTGVMRRNPDLKWKFSVEKMRETIKVQEIILDESLHFLNPKKGKIVYCTCSVLPEENLLQVIKFCDKHGFEIENGSHFTTYPKNRGMDGFFSATLIPKGTQKSLIK
eukprot:403341461